VTAEHARACASLHALEGAGELIGAPVALAGDEQRRHVDGAAGENLELGGENVLGAAAIPLQAALKAGALELAAVYRQFGVGKPLARGEMAALCALPSKSRNSRRSQPANTVTSAIVNPLMEEACITLKPVVPCGPKQPFRNGQKENFPDRIVPDENWPGIYRIRLPDGGLSDSINLTRAKDAIRQMKDQKLLANPSALKGRIAIKPITNRQAIAEDANSPT
jgi:hypothetical protein